MALCLFFSALYSGSESACISLTPAQLERLKRENNKPARLAYTLCQDIPKLLTTVLIGNNLMNIALTVIATNMTIRISGSAFLGVTTAIVTFTVLICGEIYPKQLAINNNEQWAKRIGYFVYISKYLFMPLTLVIDFFTQIFFQGARKGAAHKFTRDNVLQQIHAATGLGVLKRHTSQLLIHTLMFESTTAGTVMTHRTEMLSISIATQPREALAISCDSGFSRIPVYNQDREKIVGVVLLKDLLHLYLQESDGRGINDKRDIQDAESDRHGIQDIMYSPLFVAQSMHLDRVLLQMRKRQQHMAIVLDEYGGVAGLLTLEDLFEKIYGQLYDEHDRIERSIVSYGDRSYVIDASIPIAKLNEQLLLNIPTNRGVTTLSGYLIQLYGNVPPAYAIISSPYGSFEILAASKKKIHKARFRKRARVGVE